MCKCMAMAKWAALAIAVIAFALSALTAVNSGIGWDAPFEVELSSALLNTSANTNSVEALRQAVATQDLSKGPQLFWLANALAAILPGDGLTTEIGDPHNYLLLGLSSVLLGSAGLIALASALGYALRRPLVGWLALAAMSTMPLWVGLAAVDYRDTQVASGLSAVTAAGVLCVANRSGVMRLWATAGLSGLGTYIAIAGRSGSVLLVMVIAAWIAAVALVLGRKNVIESIRTVAVFGAGTLVGGALAVVSHPLGRFDPMGWLVEAVQFASDNPNVMLVRVMGRNITSDQSPWWYVPAWLLAQLPLASLLVAAVSVFGLVLLKPRLSAASGEIGPIIILLGQAVLLPVLILLARPNVYDGIRHFLFLIPALFSAITVIVWSLRNRELPIALGERRIGEALVTWSLIAMTALSLFAAARWYPYSYAFVNPVAGAVKEPRIWEYDYWGLTTREAVARLQREYGTTMVFVRPGARSALPFGGKEFEEYLENPNREWAGVTFYRFDAELPVDCEIDFTISRDGIPLAEAGRCS